MASQAPSPSLLLYFLVRVLLLFPPYKISIDPGEAKGRPYKSYQPTSPYLCNPFILSPKRCLIIVVSKLEKYSLQTDKWNLEIGTDILKEGGGFDPQHETSSDVILLSPPIGQRAAGCVQRSRPEFSEPEVHCS